MLKRTAILWLLAAIAVVLVPHMTHQPTWVSLFVAIIWLWRTWLAWHGLAQPPRMLIVALACVGAGLTFITYGTVFGRDAGVVLLQLMLALKLLEMRTLRDAMVSVFLGFFVLLTFFLQSQTMLIGVYALGVIWLLLVALIALNRRDEPAAVDLCKTASLMLMQATPLMLVLFLLVPRVQGPLWGIPKDSNAATSGLSEEMAPGSIGSLALSDAIAFRVEFDGPVPPSRSLYWRAIVMNDFDGRVWRVGRQFSPSPSIRGIGASITYRTTLEPHNRRWVFALDLPRRTPTGTRITTHYQLLATQPITTRTRFELSSYLNYEAGLNAAENELNDSLRLPPGNPRAQALAQSFKSQDSTPQEIISRALNYFATHGFVYTLTPPVLEGDTVDEFVFGSKAGFCEHYAGAFAFIMRAAGIPARVVTGYQGGEVNPIGNYLIVRQADAHAWTEVWLPKRGWVRIDPTAIVSPLRVDSGIRAAVPTPEFIPGLMSEEQSAWLHSIRLSWDAANNQWNQMVLGYNFERQKNLLARFGQKDASWQDLTIVLIIASLIVVTSVSAFLLLRHTKQKHDAALIAYNKFRARLVKIGVDRNPSEGPMDLATRAAAIAPELAPAIKKITVLYAELRYGTRDAAALKELVRLVNQFPDRRS